jgi:hypothetical protein
MREVQILEDGTILCRVGTRDEFEQGIGSVTEVLDGAGNVLATVAPDDEGTGPTVQQAQSWLGSHSTWGQLDPSGAQGCLRCGLRTTDSLRPCEEE